jgi:chemotaxis protein MotA
MLVIVGLLIVFGSVGGGYVAAGGHVDILWQPFEFIIILGGGLGSFIVSNNSKGILGGVGKAIGRMLKGPSYKKADYLELLTLQYQIYRLAKTKGMLALEQHIENPEESSLFQAFPKFHSDHHAVEFVCDYLRLMSLGANNPHEIEAIMDLELETHHAEEHSTSAAIGGLGDALPALGIVAAVLGVIHTMGSISEPPEVLGHLIAAALVGTFFGIFMAYGVVSPMSSAYTVVAAEDSKYYECIKSGMLAHMAGNPPTVSIEYARKCLLSHVRPTFFEVEEASDALPAPG